MGLSEDDKTAQAAENLEALLSKVFSACDYPARDCSRRLPFTPAERYYVACHVRWLLKHGIGAHLQGNSGLLAEREALMMIGDARTLMLFLGNWTQAELRIATDASRE